MSHKSTQGEGNEERTKRSFGRARLVVGAAAALAVLILVWLFVIPPSLGGRTTFVVTRGVSMQPLLYENDLVVLRKQSSYEVGDVVSYHSDTLNVTTLHRIASINDGVITTKGDNNTWLDEDHPNFSQIDGVMTHHIGGAGDLLLSEHIRHAKWLGLLLVIAAVGIGLYRRGHSDADESVEGRPRAPHELGSPAIWSKLLDTSHWISTAPRSQLARVFAYTGSGLVAVSLLAGVFAFVAPTKAKAGSVAYTIQGKFGYSGHTSGEKSEVINPDHQLSTGDPVFLNLVDQMLVSFDIAFKSSARFEGGGTVGMKMDIVGQSGWTHTVDLVEPTSFEGDRHRIGTRVSLREVSNLVRDVQSMTKVQDKTYTVSFRPDVKFKGSINRSSFEEDFAPSLTLAGNELQLKPEANSDAPVPQPKGAVAAPEGVMTGLTPSRGSRFELQGGELTRLGIIPILFLRFISIGILLVGITLLVAAYLGHRKPSAGDNPSISTKHRYSHLLVPITGIAQVGTQATVIDVPTFRDLVKVAKSSDALILHETTSGSENYYVNASESTYRYFERTRSTNPSRPRFGVDVPETDEVTQ